MRAAARPHTPRAAGRGVQLWSAGSCPLLRLVPLSDAQSRQRLKPCCSGKGFGKQQHRNGAGNGRPLTLGRKSSGALQPNELLKEFHLSPDKAAIAEKYPESLTENFFIVADAMLKMAEKEGNRMMKEEYLVIIDAAFRVRQKSLRPEIRLLNELLMSSTTAEGRRQKIGSKEGAEILVMNNRYFFGLVDGMLKDFAGRADSAEKAAVMRQLETVAAECRRRADEYERTGE